MAQMSKRISDQAQALEDQHRLIKSLEDHEIGPNSNVYAELGSTWRNLMTRPDQAAHTLGKLLKHVGQERVLWGTDSIWYGTPQDQIAAFRTFEISAERLAEFVCRLYWLACSPARKKRAVRPTIALRSPCPR